MGFLRIFLALSVVSDHIGSFMGFRLVESSLAVQAFYLISGFYMGLVSHEKYSKDSVFFYSRFYRARSSKIFIPYLLTLFCSLIVFKMANVTYYSSWNQFVESWTIDFPDNLMLVFSQLFILGTELVFFFPSSLYVSVGALPPAHLLAIPQAWSVSLELYFYLLVPIFFRFSNSKIAALIGLSILLRFLVAYFLGLSMDPWSYRFFPFELAFFLMGFLSYRFSDILVRYIGLFATAFALASLFLFIVGRESHLFAVFKWPFLIFLSLSIPGIFNLTRKIYWDNLMGDYSYYIYLVHIFVAVGLRAVGVNSVMVIVLVVVLTSVVLRGLHLKAADRLKGGHFRN